ncbi:MAG TPA: efflux RND transporter periplasmic adaptor subunit [Candidatus Baltobacteraceae bacterium]
MSTTQIPIPTNGTAAAPKPAQGLKDRLGRPARRSNRFFWPAVTLMVLIAAGVAAYFFLRARAAAAPSYQTTQVTQGTLVQLVSASGTIDPQNTIDVGTQVSGTLSQLFVDWNSRVTVGEVLAKLDPTSFQATVAQAQAQVAQAQAVEQGAGSTVGAQQATYQSNSAQIAKAQSTLTLANQTVARDKELVGHGYIAQSQLDTDVSALEVAQSTLNAAKMTAQSSYEQVATSGSSQSADQAAVQAAEANLQTAQVNLSHTIITSPVNGVVIARDISVGQTVAAGLQTPTLFAIAQDLGKMEVDLAVGEPDIGNIRPGEALDFTVLAYPNRTYHSTVAEVRKNPTTVNNVVTYTVVCYENNPDDSLLPGMTANASLHVAKAQNALIVPLQALQFRPGAYQGHTRRSAGGGGGASGSASSAPSGGGAGTATGSTAGAPAAHTGGAAASPWGATLGTSSGTLVAGGNGLIFVDRAGKAVPVRVKIALVQGTQAAVTPRVDGALTTSDQVIISDGTSGGSGQRSSSSSPLGGAGGPGGIGRALR